MALRKQLGKALGEELPCPILKTDAERRLFFSVIAESGMVDAQGDVMSAQTIDDMAHDFMIRFRRFDERHSWRQIEAMPMESWVFREDVILFGQLIKAVSWDIGVKISDDGAWQKVRPGIKERSQLEEKVSGPQEYDLRDVEVQFISFVHRGANKKQFPINSGQSWTCSRESAITINRKSIENLSPPKVRQE